MKYVILDGIWDQTKKQKVLDRTFWGQLTKWKYGLLIRLKYCLNVKFPEFHNYRRISLFSGNNTLRLRLRTMM